MENKYYFEQIDQSIHQRVIDVECYRMSDDELLGTIELKYNDYESKEIWSVEQAQWNQSISIEEIDATVSELLLAARNGDFHEFAYDCSMYDPREDEDYWFI